MSHFIYCQIKTRVLSEWIPELLLAETSKIHPEVCAPFAPACCSWLPSHPPYTHPSSLPLSPPFPSHSPPSMIFFLLFTCLIYFFPPYHHNIQRLIQYTCSIWSNLVNLNIPVKCNFKVSPSKPLLGLAQSTKALIKKQPQFQDVLLNEGVCAGRRVAGVLQWDPSLWLSSLPLHGSEVPERHLSDLNWRDGEMSCKRSVEREGRNWGSRMERWRQRGAKAEEGADAMLLFWL